MPVPQLPAFAGNTVYVSVVDRDRTAVSIINSFYHEFGCGIATEKTGIMLHNRGACFVVDPAARTRSARRSGRCRP